MKYFNRKKEQVEEEKVYGDKYIKWLYGDSFPSNVLVKVLCRAPLSMIYGYFQNVPASTSKIDPFIKEFDIDMDEFLPEDGQTLAKPYSSFNSFFIRKFKDGKRDFITEPKVMAAPAEARYFGFNQVELTQTVPVKGMYLTSQAILGNELFGDIFQKGPMLIARLCPVDYHRYHYPDDGHLIEQYRVKGVLNSVNPVALKNKGDIFVTNERQVSILETANFGKLAYIEVGALCVGKIVQTNTNKYFKRGMEKGYFLFGGSTVIILGEQGKWAPSSDILENSKVGMETYIKLGDQVASC